MDVIEHNKIKVVSDYLYKTTANPKTIVKKEMVIEPGFMMMDKEEYKIKKAKEMYEKRLAYIEEEERLRMEWIRETETCYGPRDGIICDFYFNDGTRCTKQSQCGAARCYDHGGSRTCEICDR